MVELNRVNIIPLQRQRVTGQAGQVPSSPLVPTSGIAALGQAQQALASSLQAAGNVVLDVLQEQQKQQAVVAKQRANAQAGQAVLTSRLAIEGARRAVLDNPDIAPGDRIDAFAEAMGPLIQQQAAALPESVRGAFQSRMAGTLSDTLRQMGDAGAAETLQARQDTLLADIDAIRQEKLATDDPLSLDRLDLTLETTLAEAVADGTMTQGAARTKLRAERQRFSTAQALRAIESNPWLAEDLIRQEDLAANLPAAERQALLDLAFDRQTQLNGLEDRAENQANAEQEKQQEIVAGQHAEVVYAVDATQRSLEREAVALERSLAAGTIGLSQFEKQQGIVLSRLDGLERSAKDTQEETSLAMRQRFEISLGVSISQENRDIVLSAARAEYDQGNMLQGDFSQFLQNWHQTNKAEHITNQPGVREGIKAISIAIVGVSNAEDLALRLNYMAVSDRERLADALLSYTTQMERLRQDGRLSEAREVAQAVINRYGTGTVMGANQPQFIPPEMWTMTNDEGVRHITALQHQGVSLDRIEEMKIEWTAYWGVRQRFIRTEQQAREAMQPQGTQ